VANRFDRPVSIRIGQSLYQRIVEDSEENGRTPGQTIRLILERYYRDDTVEACG
jgi:predicted DNA-binding protein